MIIILIADLFCGAGGVSEGFEQAKVPGIHFRTLAGVNHDPLAIASHAENHPDTVHFVEDITDMTVVVQLKSLFHQEKTRLEREGHTVLIWLHASLECTHFSGAKGGDSRDADSRSLADYMPAYLTALDPDFFTVENVREFMTWGPLMIKQGVSPEGYEFCVLRYDKKKKTFGPHWIPDPSRKSEDYNRWKLTIKEMGYEYDRRLLNAANYGAKTSRLRYFSVFFKPHLPIAWPEQTHAKDPEKLGGLFGKRIQRWQPVRDCLDLWDKGRSIFECVSSENTFERIYAGLVKHVANGDTAFISKYYSGDPENKCSGLDSPAGTITTLDHHSLITTEPFLMTYYSGSHNNRVKSLSESCLTLTTENRHAIVSPEFLIKYHGSEVGAHSIDQPLGTIPCNDSFGLVQAEVNFILDNKFNNKPKSINEPSPALLTGNHQYLMTVHHGTGNSHDLGDPSPTIIARQDKAPIYITTAEAAQYPCYPPILESDSEMVVKIKQFMRAYGISNIYMRMLKVNELLLIQGFSKNYVLKGSATHQKKFIGNSVVPLQMKVLAEAIATKVKSHFMKMAA